MDGRERNSREGEVGRGYRGPRGKKDGKGGERGGGERTSWEEPNREWVELQKDKRVEAGKERTKGGKGRRPRGEGRPQVDWRQNGGKRNLREQGQKEGERWEGGLGGTG